MAQVYGGKLLATDQKGVIHPNINAIIINMLVF